MHEIYLVTSLMHLDLHELIQMNNQRPTDKRIIRAANYSTSTLPV